MRSGAPEEPQRTPPPPMDGHQIKIGDLECPRCRKSFTMSYWRGDQLIQARCLSCDLRWPRPDVV